MEGHIQEHNAVKLKYHKKEKKNVQAISFCELMTGIKKSITTINVIRSVRRGAGAWGGL